jgi:hypothetical protein
MRKISKQLPLANLCLMAHVRPVWHRLSCSNETVQNAPKQEFLSNGLDQVCSLRKIPTRLYLANLCDNGTSLASFASTFCSIEMVRNAPKYEFWIQWSGLAAFVAKNSDATFFLWTCAFMAPVRPVCIDFLAVTKRSETLQNLSFGFNEVDHVRSLQKILKQLPLANLCLNGTCSSSFASTFVQ